MTRFSSFVNRRFSLILLLVLITSAVVLGTRSTTQRSQPISIQEDFDPAWKKVDSLEKKGLLKSALELVEEIIESSRKQNNHPQLIKGFIYQVKFNAQLEEDSYEKAIPALEKEIATLPAPARQVLHSVIAELYWQYYSNNRYKFLDRTTTSAFEPEDLSTWDAEKMVQKTSEHYLASLGSPATLKSTPATSYDAIIVAGDTASRHLRPTLFDFLAHRAIDFFSNSEAGITQPAYAFTLNDSVYFSDAASFIRLPLVHPDTSAFELNALRIYQQLLEFRMAEKDVAALVSSDLKRLAFVHSKSVLPAKDQLYRSALERLLEKHNAHPASAEIAWRLGQHYVNIADKNKGEKLRTKALQLCRQKMAQFPDSYGAALCRSLEFQVLQKSLSAQAGQTILPETAFRVLLSYNNIDTAYIRIVKLPDTPEWESERHRDETKFILSQKALKAFSYKLPRPSDYNELSTEIPVPALAAGQYSIAIANSPDFSTKGNGVAFIRIQVSPVAFFSTIFPDGSAQVDVRHRKTGKPLEGAQVTEWQEKYDYTSRRYKFIKGSQYKTDKNGIAKLPVRKEYRNYYLEVTHNGDKAFSDSPLYQYAQHREEDKVVVRTWFFTDRAIYRPGQTIHFKGLITEARGDSNRILAGKETAVTLYDVNSQKVSESTFTTNEYGTFSGTFTLPTSGMNGQMRISDKHGSAWFSVEEYKRPKFEVKIDPVKGDYKLGENITVTGKAISYSGAAISESKVSYRVVRRANFPFWRYYWRSYFPTSPQMEIANGTVKTDDEGNFTITFPAIPDESINRQFEPVFQYSVYADVTDIGGETRSGSTTVAAGYKSLLLISGLTDKINQENPDSLRISATNLNNQPQARKVTVKIFKAEAPTEVYRERLWEMPDTQLLSRSEFRDLFPLDAYLDEDQPGNWKKGEQVFSQTIQTGEKPYAFLPELFKTGEQGRYILELSATDAFGEPVTKEEGFILFNPSLKALPVPLPSWFVQLDHIVKPGGQARFLIGSGWKDVQVRMETEQKGKITSGKWINVSNSQELISFPITEKHRGNISFHFTFVRHNRFYQFSTTVIVPYENRQLDLTLETFRDKLKPGGNEEWTLLVTRKDGTPAEAEVLATMYDASLDAFSYHNFALNIWNYDYQQLYRNSNYSFGIKHSLLQAEWNNYPHVPFREFDQLNWFGFYYYYRGHYFSAVAGEPQMVMDQTVATGETAESTGGSRTRNAKMANGVERQEMDNLEEDDRSDKDAEQKAERPGPPQQQPAAEARKNLQETAFFYPHLRTNAEGKTGISFVIPEALTRWNFKTLAHTRDLSYGLLTEEVVTAKELMITPNLPRFFRNGDTIVITARISNLSEKTFPASATLKILDPVTLNPAKGITATPLSSGGELKAGGNIAVSWKIVVENATDALLIVMNASGDKHTDGEQHLVPVLPSKVLVTESLPLHIRGGMQKNFIFEKLLASGASKTLDHHQVSVEFTSNPSWYVVQALPYLMEYPYECSEQIFNRYYANIIASGIVNQNPKIKAVIESWQHLDPSALLSALEKNQDLKQVLLTETPWVLEAQNESERKKRISLLFDLNKMASELSSNKNKLQKAQASNGGFPWFKGMPDDRYITQYIVAGYGHLLKLGFAKEDGGMDALIKSAVTYMDARLAEDLEALKKVKADLDKDHLGYLQIQYLYARSFFLDIKVPARSKEAYDYYVKQAATFWTSKNKYAQGMIALHAKRSGGDVLATDIVNSLAETAIRSDELGMYWKDYNQPGYYWHQAPTETQSLLIEAFKEVKTDLAMVDELRLWLLKNKQTNNWRTTKATADACYAVLLSGTDWLQTEPDVKVKLGSITIDPASDNVQTEAGTGYFRVNYPAKEVRPEMGNISISKTGPSPGWGAVYWQYFEAPEKVTASSGPLSVTKEVFIEKPGDRGPVIVPASAAGKIEPGDKVIIRLVIKTDRRMEYVHLKDQRGAGLEPVNVISRAKYQDGLIYYESTKDASTDFFFNVVPRGTYVFEYPLRVTHAGNYSNGLATISCMYAPEFTAHSAGKRFRAEKP